MASETASILARQPSGSAAMKEPEVEEGNEETLAVENASEDSGAANGGVKLTDEGDAVVDSVKVDAAEAVRSGTAVVEGSKVETAKDEEGVGEEEAVESLDVGSVAGNEETLAVENASEDSGAANGGVKFTDEGDAVVDSVKVDAAEAVRSGTAVVEGSKVETPKDEEGVGEEGEVESLDVGSVAGKDEENSDILTSASKGSSVKNSTYAEAVVSGSAAAKDKEDTKESVVGGGNEENHAVEFASGDSAADVGNKYTGEGDAVVDSINVDAAEAVRSGNAVVGDFEGTKDLGAELESSVAENAGQVVENSDANGSAPEVGEFEGTKDSGAELERSVAENAGQVLENSVANGSAPEESKLIKTDGVKSTDEKDSVVDSINVDVVQAARSGVAAVGDSEVNATEPEVKEDSARVAENVTSANEFAALATANSSEIVDVDDEQPKVSQLDEAEAPQPVESVEEQDIEKTKPEADLLSKQQEPTNEQHSNHGGESEKVQPLDVETKERSVELDGLDAAASDIPSPANGVNAEEENLGAQEKVDDEGTGTDEDGELVYFGGGNSSNKIIEELESGDRSEMMDGQVVTESEDGESDEEGEGKELFDSSAFAALLKAATSSGSDPGTITISSQDGSRLFSVQRPAGLGPSLRSVRPASGPRDSNFISPSSAAVPSEENLSEEEKNKLQNLQQLKVKFLRLVQRVGYTAEHSVAAQVLYKLSFFGGRPAIPAFSLDNAKQTAMQLEAEGKDDLNFSLTILVLGKTGVGKSAVINSILLEEKAKINAFEPETTSVNEIYGTVDGVKIRFIDVPGLKSAAIEQGYNRKVLESVKKITKKNPVDVVFYVDRLDSQTRDLNDLPMLRTITSSLGSSIWRNTIITLTHASCAPPDGPSGTPLSYEVFVAQRSHIAQQSIGQAVGDLRLMNLNMMSPVSLVENHHACRKNREGQKVLPNGQAWRPQLLVLCYSVKILSEASSSAKPQDPFDSRKLFGFRVRSPPLPYLLSSMLQPRAHPKLSADQGGDNVDSDIDLDDLSDSGEEDELDEYDQLPPFKPLRKSQLAKLSNEQKKAYFEEYDYRVKLLQKKQWKEELKRMKEMKKGKSGVGAYGEMPEDDSENADGENGTPAPVPVPLPDMALPPTFDSDNPAYRYRFLEPTSQFLARPVLDTHGWDHDCGYDGVNVEQNLGIAGRFPLAVTAQVTKDKKDFNVHLDSAVAAKHGENGSSLLGFDVQSIGKQYAYIVKGESKFKNLKKNKTTAGVSVTFLGENVAPGVKVEDQITLGKRLVLVGSTGTVRSRKEAAYGANLEVRLREADYPVGQEQSTFTLSLMKWRGDLAIGGNLQSQISVGRNSKMALRVALNNKQSGQITVKTSSSDHLSLAIAGLVPIALSIYQKFKPGVSPSYSIY
uniref:Chloroplast preprotein import receptor Toc159 n=1 Tax=Bienertia sinuspersici TaxID=338654 RepID=I3XHK2_9CARY|nr:chloroplast preprotein import receptor Toc159 [Bienertia sinuspersici]